MRWLAGITDSIDEFEKTPGDCEGQGRLMCCGSQGHKESDMTEQLNSKKLFIFLLQASTRGYPLITFYVCCIL